MHQYWPLVRDHFFSTISPSSPEANHQPQRSFTIVDVGANKGLISAQLLRLFAPELEVDPSLLAVHIDRYFKMRNVTARACGPCGCVPSKLKSIPSGGAVSAALARSATAVAASAAVASAASGLWVTVHSIEPNAKLAAMGKELTAKLFPRTHAHRDKAAWPDAKRLGGGTQAWRWHAKMALGDAAEDASMEFSDVWDEGSHLVARPKDSGKQQQRLQQRSGPGKAPDVHSSRPNEVVSTVSRASSGRAERMI